MRGLRDQTEIKKGVDECKGGTRTKIAPIGPEALCFITEAS